LQDRDYAKKGLEVRSWDRGEKHQGRFPRPCLEETCYEEGEGKDLGGSQGCLTQGNPADKDELLVKANKIEGGKTVPSASPGGVGTLWQIQISGRFSGRPTYRDIEAAVNTLTEGGLTGNKPWGWKPGSRGTSISSSNRNGNGRRGIRRDLSGNVLAALVGAIIRKKANLWCSRAHPGER